MKKSRFFYLHPEANAGKVAALDALQEAYTTYLKTCVEVMLSKRRFLIPLREMQSSSGRRNEMTDENEKAVGSLSDREAVLVDRIVATGIMERWCQHDRQDLCVHCASSDSARCLETSVEEDVHRVWRFAYDYQYQDVRWIPCRNAFPLRVAEAIRSRMQAKAPALLRDGKPGPIYAVLHVSRTPQEPPAKEIRTMKVYVASSFADKETLAQPYMAKLREACIEVTHDWTVPSPHAPPEAFAPGAVNELSLSLDIQQKLAEEDLLGVQKADAIWIIAPPTGGTGCWIELGYALKTRRSQRSESSMLVFTSGPRRSIFASLTEHFDEHDEALAHIILLSKKNPYSSHYTSSR